MFETVFWGLGLTLLILPGRWRRFWPAWVGPVGLTLQSTVVWAGAHTTLAGTDVYALVSSDSDYTPLAHFLRERGVKVLGFGRPTTASSFQAACTSFTALQAGTAAKPKSELKEPREPKRQPTLDELLGAAITKNADKQGWARVSAVANHMRQHDGQTAKDHGKASWTKVLKSLPGYEFRNEGTTSVSVRVKPLA